jgi:hypothetical protein
VDTRLSLEAKAAGECIGDRGLVRQVGLDSANAEIPIGKTPIAR